MAHANKRITVTLIIVAFLFILTIILLIIPYKGPSYTYDSSSSDEQTGGKVSHSSTSTTSTLPSTLVSILKSTSTSTSVSTSTKRKEYTPETSGMSLTTISSSNDTSFASTDLGDISDTTSGLKEEYSTTYSTDSTDYVSNTTSYEGTSYGGENDISRVSETTETSRGSETEDTDMSNITTSTSAYNESSSEHSTSDDKNETSTILSTDILGNETTDVSSTYSTEYGLSDSYTTINFTTTMGISELPVNTTTTIYENLTSVSTEETTTGYSVDSTSISTTTTSVDSTSESTDETTTISEVFVTETCTSDECKQLAARMLDLMNHSMDPCQDFYQYSCGNGVDNPYLSPVNPRDAAMSRIKDAVLSSTPENPARVFYDSCLDKTNPTDKERIDYLKELVKELGEYDPRPELPENKSHTSPYDYIDDKSLNFTSMLAKMMKNHFTPFFDLTLDVNNNDTSQFILKLTPPLFQSPLTENIRQYTCLNEYYQQLTKESTNNLDEFYAKYKNCTEKGSGIGAYTQSILKSAKKINLFKNVPEDFLGKIENSINWEVADVYTEDVLNKFPNQGKVRENLLNREYTLYTLQEMDNEEESKNPSLKNDIFSWHSLVEELLEQSVDPATTYVQVYFPDEMFEVIDGLNYKLEEDEEDGTKKLRNILLALWTHYLYSNLMEPLGHTPHSEEYCLSLVTELLPDVTTQLYLSSFDPNCLKNQIEKVEEISNQVKVAFMSQFTDESNDLTEMIKKKIESMKLDKGENLLEDYQDFIDKLPQVKEELNKEDFPRNVIQLLNRNRRILYSFYNKDPSNRFIMWLRSNLPYYTSDSMSYPLNIVLVPIGSIESPFYEQNGPDFINFAGLGQMISHEIMHAFDSTGARFELENAQNMVKPSEQCQKKQLKEAQTFIINDVSMNAKLPVDLVLNEALSDSSAVRMAWETYRINKDVEKVHRERRAAKGQRPKSSKFTLKHDQAHSFEVLPWLDANPLKQFYIRSAQIHCEKSSRVNLLHLKENEHIHGSLRVNHMARNDPLFQEAFSCPNDSLMNKDPKCSYIPLSHS